MAGDESETGEDGEGVLQRGRTGRDNGGRAAHRAVGSYSAGVAVSVRAVAARGHARTGGAAGARSRA